MNLGPGVGFATAEDVEVLSSVVATSGPSKGDAGGEPQCAGEEGSGAGEMSAVALAGFEEKVFEWIAPIRNVDFERIGAILQKMGAELSQ